MSNASVAVKTQAWFEYAGSHEETRTTGLRMIFDPESDRWEGELMEPPFKGNPQGRLVVAEVTRVNGEILKKRVIKVISGCHMNKARSFMREYYKLDDSGDSAPWDQTRYHRELLESANKAHVEGRKEDLEKMAGLLREALKAPSESPVMAVDA